MTSALLASTNISLIIDPRAVFVGILTGLVFGVIVALLVTVYFRYYFAGAKIAVAQTFWHEFMNTGRPYIGMAVFGLIGAILGFLRCNWWECLISMLVFFGLVLIAEKIRNR